jgi:branched-chain amino acid transport system substrate-binding protein
MIKFFLLFACIFTASSASADIIIGQTTGVTGSQAEAVKETMAGAQLYIAGVNQRGGVNGQKIQLVTLDDKQDPKLSAANARKLITETKAVALFLTRGTPQTEAIIPVLDEFDVPVIAPSTGAISLHTPVKKNVFNVRAPYRVESAKGILLLKRMGVSDLGIISVDDSFGADVLQGVLDGMKANGIKPAFALKFDKSFTEFTKLAKEATGSKPQAVVVIGSGSTAAKIMKAIRATGSTAQLVTFSNNASSGFIKDLGDVGRGVVVTQVFPNERSMEMGISREAIAANRDAGGTSLTPSMLEGYVGAKILVEGLRRAGNRPTGLRIHKALESMNNFDIGGMVVSYSTEDHSGLEFVDLSIINKDGIFKR